MEDLRVEARNLVEQIPEDYLFGAVEALKFFATTKDPFYCNENQKHLTESIAQFESGNFKEHELIEDD